MVVTDSPNQPTRHGLNLTGQTLQARLSLVRPTGWIVGGLTLLAAIVFTALLFGQFTWQMLTLSCITAFTSLVFFFTTTTLYPRGRILLGVILSSLFLGISLLALSLLLSNMGITSAIVILVYALIISSAFQEARIANFLTISGIVNGMICAITPQFLPIPQLNNSFIAVITPAILGILFMVYVVLLAMQFIGSYIRTRVVTSFIAIVVIPLAILSFVASNFTFTAIHDQRDQQLKMAASQTAAALTKYIKETQEAFYNVSQMDVFARYLLKTPDQRSGSADEKELLAAFKIIEASKSGNMLYTPSYALIDAQGNNVFDTTGNAQDVSSNNLLQMGKGSHEGGQEYYKVPFLTGSKYFSPMMIVGKESSVLVVSAPIKDANGKAIGVLRARYNGLIIQQFIRDYNGLISSSSYVLVLDNNNITIADGYEPQYLLKAVGTLTTATMQSLQYKGILPTSLSAGQLSMGQQDFDQLINNYAKRPFFNLDLNGADTQDDLPEYGVIYPMQIIPWKIVYLMENYNDDLARKQQQSVLILLTVLVTGIVGIIAVGTSQLLNQPITSLMVTAQLITRGNFEAQAPANEVDEYGMLGSAFNMMTYQMRQLINGLEERVRGRTQQIENQNQVLMNRARQLQTVSDVARQIVSMQEIEALLSSVVQMVSERFDFYHVGVFLLDENKEFAVLRAANSQGGQRMLARNHMLPVGRVGIVGHVTGTGEPRIATDVGADATFFNNPDLPLTRSEMALPLKVGNQTIGALDIQSTQSSAFHDDDIELFTTLADQVAIAIYNNQLYTETLRALNESQTLHRQYLRSEWEQEIAVRKVHGYLFNRKGIAVQDVELPIWHEVISSGKPIIEVIPGASGTPDQTALAVPITVRGEAIGVIHVQDQGQEHSWSEDELAVVNEVANQVAVALENARLFESTVRRAEREKKVLEITARIRSTNEPDRMMQIAINELQRALGASRTQIYVRKHDEDGNGNHGNNGSQAGPSQTGTLS